MYSSFFHFHFLNFNWTKNILSQTLLQRCPSLFLMLATSLIFARQLVISVFSPPPSIGLITTVPFSHVCLWIKDSCAEQSGLTLASTCIPAPSHLSPGYWFQSWCTPGQLSGLSRWVLVYLQSACTTGWWHWYPAKCGCYMEFRFLLAVCLTQAKFKF